MVLAVSKVDMNAASSNLGGPETNFAFALEAIRSHFPYFNERPVTEADFWRAAKRAKIIVRRMPILVPGYYQFKRGRHYILIDERLAGMDFLTTALHEFCHYLFDVPNSFAGEVLYKNNAASDDPREKFANAFALAAVLPRPDLERLAHEDISDDLDLLQLCRDRIKVLAEFRI